jgi:hypothetical protein
MCPRSMCPQTKSLELTVSRTIHRSLGWCDPRILRRWLMCPDPGLHWSTCQDKILLVMYAKLRLFTVQPYLTQHKVSLSLCNKTASVSDALSKGTHHPRDALSKGHKIQGIQNPRRITQGYLVQGYSILSLYQLTDSWSIWWGPSKICQYIILNFLLRFG